MGLRTIAVAAGLLFALAPPAAADTRPLLFGLNDGFDSSDAEAAQHLDLHAPLGTTVVRTGIAWRAVQPERDQAPRWGIIDRVHRAAEARGMKVVGIVSSIPPWAQQRNQLSGPCLRDRYDSACQPPPMRSALPAFASFVRQYVQRYQSIAAVEVFNEPNVGNFTWQPQADPAYYTEVLRVVAAAVREVRPDLPVISGGIAPPPFPRPSGALTVREFLEGMYRAGAKGAMDAIGVHPYAANHGPTSDRGFRSVLDEVRSIRDAAGDTGRPLWVTEFGYTTAGPFAVSLEQQAEWLRTVVGEMLRMPDVPGVIVHTLYDQPEDPESAHAGWGLVSAAGDLKPSYEAVKRAVAAVRAERTPKPKRKAKRRRARVRCAAPRPPRKRTTARASSVRCGGRP